MPVSHPAIMTELKRITVRQEDAAAAAGGGWRL